MDSRVLIQIKTKAGLKEIFKHASKTVLSQFRYEKIPPGKTIIEKGSPVGKIFIICSGRLRISNEFPTGRRYEFGAVENLGFSGLLEFFAGKDLASSTVQTVSETIILSISRNKFANWIEEDHAALRLIVGFFAKQMYPTTKSIGFIFSYPGVYSFLRFIAQQISPQIARNGRGVVPLTREEAANQLGLSLRTVYRLTARLKEHGFIRVEKRKITVDAEQYRNILTYLEDFD